MFQNTKVADTVNLFGWGTADTQKSVSTSLLEEISKNDVSNSLLTGGLWIKAVLQKLWALGNSW